MNMNLIPVAQLAGRVVVHWQAAEMALAEGHGERAVRWEDPDIPFLQLINLDLRFDDGAAFRLLTQLVDGTGFHGFYLFQLDALTAPRPYEDPSSIYRELALPELPVGAIDITHVRHDGPNAIVEIRLRVAGADVRLLAAEVEEQRDGTLIIVEPDEAILLQVNGVRPSRAS